MTREEAINYLTSTGLTEEQVMEVVEALNQDPCNDAISRQEVLDIVDSYSESRSNVEDVTQDIISDILALPPVNSQPKMGHWKRISIDKYVQHAMAYYKCSVCDKDIIGTHNYCPSCGAKMEVEV